MSKVEVRKLEIEEIPLSLSSVLMEVVRLLRSSAEQKGLALHVAPLPSSVPDRICSDPTRIYQVLSNLLVNAIKFTHRGKIEIALSSRCVGQDCFIDMRVKDTGIGISQENLQRLFAPFSQADNSLSRRFGGTGLGLALSRSLCDLMGGDLVLESTEEGAGSTFLATIKANLQSLREPRDHGSQGSKSLQSEEEKYLFGIRVLLAEDSPDNQVLIKRFLTAEGALVEIARNGLEAFDMALKQDFHIVLMDIQMPVLDGYSATQRLRRVGYDKPIIALTAHALKEEQERSLGAGCNEHLTKPINRQLLISVIGKFVFQR